MGRKLSGIVCDNPSCFLFISYAYEDAISRCVIITIRRETWTYCSKECSERGKEYRQNVTKDRQ